jgi:hypothetical protein
MMPESAKNSQRRKGNPASIETLTSRDPRRRKIRKMSRKTRDANHVAMQALMIHGHTSAATRADVV